MCSRYSLTAPPEAVRAYFGHGETPNFPARFNIARTQPVAEWTGPKGKRRPAFTSAGATAHSSRQQHSRAAA
jgi:putative SOS response-associated peptidase YedK